MAVRTKKEMACVLLMIGLVVAVEATGACPGVKWKGGKQTVECRNRGLITLPSNIDPQTQVLDLSGSNLQTLPREAFMRAGLLNLQKVYLATCRIGRVDDSAFKGLTNLIELDLSDNLLTDVPSGAFRDATSLRELRLNSNPIRKVEQGAFESAPGLVKLDLSECQIDTLAPGAFDGLDQLSHLRLGGNRLAELRPNVVSSLPSRLHGLELHGNPWICDCRLRHLREWLQKHNIPSPASAACTSPPRLAGRALVELQVDDFACPPQVIPPAPAPLLPANGGGGGPPHLHVEAAAGQNATLTCRMSGVPSPEITWLWRGRVVANASGVPFDNEDNQQPPASSSGGDTHPAGEFGGRTVLILEEGKYEKTSQLIISPAREVDSGDFVCVAANPAGMARVNLTLRVDVPPPVVGGLGGAQIAGLGAGLFILLAVVVAILLLMLIRTRGSSSGSRGGDPNKPPQQQLHQQVQQHSAGGGFPANGTAKSPSLSALEYGQVAFIKPTSPGQVIVIRTPGGASPGTSGPDLIYDARGQGVTASDFATMRRRQADMSVPGLGIAGGDYQSAQTDSFYPSALWDHVLPPLTGSDGAVIHGGSTGSGGSPLHLPHIPLGVAEVYGSSTSGQVIANPMDRGDSDDAGESTVSVDSYSLPCRIPQQLPDGQQPLTARAFVPYPADYGLPRTQSPVLLPAVLSSPSHVASSLGAAPPLSQHNSSSSCYGSKVNSSAESSPANGSPATKSPRFWHRPGNSNPGGGGSGATTTATAVKRNHHHFARDSPDEGYQEECATDV